MKTVSLPIQLNKENTDILNDYRRRQSSVIRMAYNKFNKDITDETTIRNDIKSKIELPVYMITCGIKEGKQIAKSENELKKIEIKELEKKIDKLEKKKLKSKKGKLNQKNFRKLKRLKRKLYKTINRKVLFGGRKNYYDYQKGLITKDEFKEKRLSNLIIQGQNAYAGNRNYDLDIINNNRILCKLSATNRFYIELPNLKKKIKEELHRLEEMCKLNQYKYTIRLTDKEIKICYEEMPNKLENLLDNRVLGIDLNPNYIGISIIEFENKVENNSLDEKFKIIHKVVFDLTELNKCKTGKKHFEMYEISKKILKIAKSFNVGKISIEELSIRSNDIGKGKKLNKLCNNDWIRDLLISNLTKKCKENGIKLIEVNPCYTSFIGNILHGNVDCPDMIAASVEIARRAYKKYVKGWFYPRMCDVKELKNLWKEDSILSCTSWIELYNIFKNSEMLYRVPLVVNSLKTNCLKGFRKNSRKSRVFLYSFI